MRFKVGDIVRISKNDPSYNKTGFTHLQGISGIVKYIETDTTDPIEVDFSICRDFSYYFEEQELKLFRRNI